MTNLHKIRARIRSVNSTQQITRTMKMIAVSKLRKTQTSLAGVRLFADKRPSHHFTVTEGEIISSNFFIYLVLDHFSGAVKIEPCSFFLWIFIADI